MSEFFFFKKKNLPAEDPKRKTLSKELEEEENMLKQCIEKLKSVEASRVALVSQLKEALHEQVCNCTIKFLNFKKFVRHRVRIYYPCCMCCVSRFCYSPFFLKCFQESELENVRTQMQVYL